MNYNLVQFYRFNDIESCFQNFCNDTALHISDDDYKQIVEWSKSDEPLSSFYPRLGFSKGGVTECFQLTNDVVIKITAFWSALKLYQKYLTYPVLDKYIVPTHICVIPPKTIDFSLEHVNTLTPAQMETLQIDCLILQPKCDKISSEDFFNWKRSYEDIWHCWKNPQSRLLLDINNSCNLGIYKDQIKLFDW